MKNYYLSILFLTSFNFVLSQTLNFGEDISKHKIIENEKVEYLYDTETKFNTKFQAKVTDVCQVKGCWMKLDIGNDKEVMVNFKDYGFFVPKDIIGKEVLISGEAFKKTISINELKHYAHDRGDSKEKINSIIKPKDIYSITANGVVILTEY